MKKEEQTNSQLSVLDAGREIQIRKTKKTASFVIGAAICVYGFSTGHFFIAAIGAGLIVLANMMWKSPSAAQVIDVESRTQEQALKSRLNKLKFGEHPQLGEKAANLYDRYLIVFKQTEKILYEKLNPQEITAQRFQKVFDEMKENLQSSFAKISQTLELSSKENLDQLALMTQMKAIEDSLFEVTQAMDSLQKTQLGTSNSTFDQSFLVEEMKKLTARIQKME